MNDELPKKHYKVRESITGGWYYVQVGANGEVMNTSEIYTRREDALRGVYDANPGAVGCFELVIAYEQRESQR